MSQTQSTLKRKTDALAGAYYVNNDPVPLFSECNVLLADQLSIPKTGTLTVQLVQALRDGAGPREAHGTQHGHQPAV